MTRSFKLSGHIAPEHVWVSAADRRISGFDGLRALMRDARIRDTDSPRMSAENKTRSWFAESQIIEGRRR